METLGIIANCAKPRARETVRHIARRARGLGMRVLAEAATAALVPEEALLAPSDLLDGCDAVVAVGGDGTMLRIVRALDGRPTPVIGVKVGGLGFLTTVSEDELDGALECLRRDQFTIKDAAMANVAVIRGGAPAFRYRALNEVVIRAPSVRVLTLALVIDGDPVTSYVCDGLIVATPSGSTGHSLSAGGPILSPGAADFVVSVICPHSLASRPLIVPDRSEISIAVSEASTGVLISIDGQVSETLAQGDLVQVNRSPTGARFIRLPGYSFYSVLRQKLHWSGSSVSK